ncbi:hypothetical protein [Photorhabdus bodei]|uniref:Uncharacterized protein n=1 Tax=Photorhabdus bodei TaxID=2029681 RepID=A0ABX0ASN7_9GAMM|nr:hypothetical protein [Photorhabdus bodei]NDL01475.1 hypothetical protein [Photorhabdus bodei]NDL05742.1 hypothetical protein [Photorhabdus bodei]NDL09946.1 hypothetical protein [Photorhabdus bodei]
MTLNLAAFCCTRWYFNAGIVFAGCSKTQGVTFCGLPLKVTPQPKSTTTLTGSRLLHHAVNLTLHF